METAADAALALKPLAGKYCSALFAFGLLNASLFAASILPLSTAFLVCEGLGWETGVNKKFSEAPQFYGLYSLLIFLGAGIILLPGIPLFSVMYVSQIINGIVLPADPGLHAPPGQQQEADGGIRQQKGLQHHLLDHGGRPDGPDRRLYHLAARLIRTNALPPAGRTV